MAPQMHLDKQVKSVLKYSTSWPYFGKFRFSELYNAQRNLRRAEYYDEQNDRSHHVYVGKINGPVICGALWQLMEYNPVRFTVNPFLYNGKMNIFRFVTDFNIAPGTQAYDVLLNVRYKLRDYLFANAKKNGQWNDEIATDASGYVMTVLKDGRTGPMYKKLCLLRDAVQLITRQNCTDFDSKRGPYRTQIIERVKSKHPDLFHVSVPDYTDIDDEEDRIYEKIERCQTVLDCRDNVSNDAREQALAEMSYWQSKLEALISDRKSQSLC